MSIEDFKYYWRFSDEKYAVLSKQELSTISVISKDEVEKEWIRICEKEIFQESAYINDIVHHSAPVLIKDCQWGENEDKTREAFEIFFSELNVDKILIYYDCENGLQLPINLFCTKWSDFCYPSDLVLILLPSVMIVYYEDIVYGPYRI